MMIEGLLEQQPVPWSGLKSHSTSDAQQESPSEIEQSSEKGGICAGTHRLVAQVR